MKHGSLLLGLVLLMLVVAGASAIAANKYLNRSTDQSRSLLACPLIKNHHTVVFENNQIYPVDTSAQLCDSLTIVNKDNRVREIAFGPHDHHRAYDGIAERFLSQGQSLTVTLNQAGNFTFHDHIEDSLVGYFSVSRP